MDRRRERVEDTKKQYKTSVIRTHTVFGLWSAALSRAFPPIKWGGLPGPEVQQAQEAAAEAEAHGGARLRLEAQRRVVQLELLQAIAEELVLSGIRREETAVHHGHLRPQSFSCRPKQPAHYQNILSTAVSTTYNTRKTVKAP